jgi:hypothetical protein
MRALAIAFRLRSRHPEHSEGSPEIRTILKAGDPSRKKTRSG